MAQLFTEEQYRKNTFQAKSTKGKLKGLRVPKPKNFFEQILLKYYILTTYFKNTSILQNLLCEKSKRRFDVNIFT